MTHVEMIDTIGNPIENQAYSAIVRQLGVSGASNEYPAPTCFQRLNRALASTNARGPARASRLDLAVLIRQCLRFHDSQSGFLASARLRVPDGPTWPTIHEWDKVGVDAVPGRNETTIQAKPWLPHWLPDTMRHGVDASAVSETQLRKISSVPGDPFISRIKGHEHYQSPGQRSAVRAALSAPPGSTLVVCLPTGEGKSFVFQSIASFGYGATVGGPGVTLVVTPTVALALDHERRARETGIAEHAVAYTGGTPRHEQLGIVNRVRRGTQGLLFASPEAVCRSLNGPLNEAASLGYLRAIVIDEAHLVDAWGANFRAEFQLLGGIRERFLENSPEGTRPRTLLLSATFTATTLETLQSIFPGDPASGGTQLVSATQLRPEIEYWTAKPTHEEERERRVTEVLTHMPRPAILYVTEVDHAGQWYRSLTDLGFGRMAMMTGRSSAADRLTIINDWRDQNLDLVIGTSAFGLGIDNPNVRTVVHACVPETLDRFYQEVGRSGRDGKVAASIIVPERDDRYWERDDYQTARSLNRRRFLTVEVAHRRWNAMFTNSDKVYEGDGAFQLRTDVSPGTGAEHIDMVGETNTGWNQRTLTLMANAGMIELLGPMWEGAIESDKEGDPGQDSYGSTGSREVHRVKVKDPRHLEISAWQEQVEPYRKSMETAYRGNLNKMFRFLEDRECAADLLAPVYEVEWNPSHATVPAHVPVARACAGCPHCRRAGTKRPTETPQIPKIPWIHTTGISAPASRLLDATHRVLVFYDSELDRRTLRRWVDSIAALATCGVRNLIAPPGIPLDAKSVQEKLPDLPIFASSELPPRDYLPPGPVSVIVPPGKTVPELLIRPRQPDDAHFIFVHRETEEPGMAGVLLRDRFEGPQLANLDLFFYRMSQ